MKKNETAIIRELRKLAKKASDNAYSPYSKAKVGSALLTAKGTMYSGHNIENSSYGATICAERVAISQAISNEKGQKGRMIEKLYIYSKDGWPPCGICRQVISEFMSRDLEIIIGNEKGEERIMNFCEIYPMAFTQEYLKVNK